MANDLTFLDGVTVIISSDAPTIASLRARPEMRPFDPIATYTVIAVSGCWAGTTHACRIEYGSEPTHPGAATAGCSTSSIVAHASSWSAVYDVASVSAN